MSIDVESEVVQLLYKLTIRCFDDEDDYDGDNYRKPETQLSIFPDLLNTFTHSYQARTEPYYQLPEGVKGHNYFLSFDKELGAVLCVCYSIPHKILYNTENLRDALTKLDNDLNSSFDSWINCHFEFTSGKQTFSVSANCGPDRIVTPIWRNYLLYRWNSIEEIEHVELALNDRNDAHNILFDPEQHAQELELVNRRLKSFTELAEYRGENPDENPCIQDDRNLLEMFKWVKAHKDRYFRSTYC